MAHRVTPSRYTSDWVMCEDGGHATGWELLIAVHRFQHRMQVFLDESLQELGISFAQLRILELLDVRHDLHLSELARQLRLSRQAVRSTVEKLGRAGLVEVEREAHASHVMISELGRNRLRRFRAAAHPIPGALEKEFTPARISGLLRAIRAAEDCLESPQEPIWWLSA